MAVRERRTAGVPDGVDPCPSHTDPKVRAHVTLCMLALLLERTIERRLKSTHLTDVRSAAACFEELRPCSLNRIRSDQGLDPTYVLAEATQEQQAVVLTKRKLGSRAFGLNAN